MTVSDSKFVFKCLAISEKGKVRKTDLPKLEIGFVGNGNVLTVEFPDGTQHKWERAYRPPPQPTF